MGQTTLVCPLPLLVGGARSQLRYLQRPPMMPRPASHQDMRNDNKKNFPGPRNLCVCEQETGETHTIITHSRETRAKGGSRSVTHHCGRGQIGLSRTRSVDGALRPTSMGGSTSVGTQCSGEGGRRVHAAKGACSGAAQKPCHTAGARRRKRNAEMKRSSKMQSGT